MMFRFNLKYFILTVLIFAIEALIAIYVHGRFLRPYGGDILASVFVYCFVKSVINSSVNSTALWSLLFSYIVEVTQYFHLVDVIGLGNSTLARCILGTSFSFVDMLMYTIGIILVLFFERYFSREVI